MDVLSVAEARKLIRAIVENGTVRFVKHLEERCQQRKILRSQIIFALERGIVSPGEFENGAWRYRVRSSEIEVVVEIETESLMICITAWRTR